MSQITRINDWKPITLLHKAGDRIGVNFRRPLLRYRRLEMVSNLKSWL